MDKHIQLGSGDDDSNAASGSHESEARREALRAAVKRGIEDVEEGRVVDLEQALERIEAMLDELEATRPVKSVRP